MIYPNCGFQTNYDEIELKISYDVITSAKNVSTLTSQDFSILGLAPIKIFGYTSARGGGVNLSRFCADVFYRRRPLIKKLALLINDMRHAPIYTLVWQKCSEVYTALTPFTRKHRCVNQLSIYF